MFENKNIQIRHVVSIFCLISVWFQTKFIDPDVKIEWFFYELKIKYEYRNIIF